MGKCSENQTSKPSTLISISTIVSSALALEREDPVRILVPDCSVAFVSHTVLKRNTRVRCTGRNSLPLTTAGWKNFPWPMV
jgi:hypothetical protein